MRGSAWAVPDSLRLPGVPTDRTNLVWKGAQLLWEAAGRSGEPRNAVVTLQKNIPMKAGSAAEAAMRRQRCWRLRRLWKLRVPDEQIHALAARLGSDVPFFLVGGTALGLGRGEEVYPLENLPRHHVVLVIPPFGVATKDAYQWLDEGGKRGREGFSLNTDKNPSRPLFPNVPLVNDLEAPVIDRHPMIGQLKQQLTDRGALMAAMSGSGSTVFGVFKSAVRRQPRGARVQYRRCARDHRAISEPLYTPEPHRRRRRRRP